MTAALTDKQQEKLEVFIHRSWYGAADTVSLSLDPEINCTLRYAEDTIFVEVTVSESLLPNGDLGDTMNRTSSPLATLAMRLRGALWMTLHETPEIEFQLEQEPTTDDPATFIATLSPRASGLAETTYR